MSLSTTTTNNEVIHAISFTKDVVHTCAMWYTYVATMTSL